METLLRNSHVKKDIPTSGSAEYITSGVETGFMVLAEERAKVFNEAINVYGSYQGSYQLNTKLGRPYIVRYANENLIPETNLDYFHSLNSVIGISNLMDFSFLNRANYVKLFGKYEEALKLSAYVPNTEQKMTFINILKELSKYSSIFDFSDYAIKVSADEELLVMNEKSNGIHYIIVGKENQELFYGFSGKLPGEYNSQHYKSTEEIVYTFLTK